MRRRVGAVDAAGQHRDRRRRRPASAPRWAAWSMPKAAPETTATGPRPAPAAMLARRPRRRRSSPSASRPPPRPLAARRAAAGRGTQSPSGGPPRSCSGSARGEVVELARPLVVAGDHEPDAQPRRPARGRRSGSSAAQPRGHVGAQLVDRRARPAALVAPRPRRARRPARRAAGRRARPSRAQRHPGQPLVRPPRSSRPASASVAQHAAARRARSRSATSTSATPGPVDARAGRRPSRPAGAPGPRRAGVSRPA